MSVVLVCGGRDFVDERLLYRVLDRRHAMAPFSKLVHGNARGADSMAARWATDRAVPVVGYPAQWDLYGRSAGPRRNAQMLELEKPDLVIAFPTGGPGTADMIGKAHTANIRVVVVREGAEV
jgi:hypothetical protein